MTHQTKTKTYKQDGTLPEPEFCVGDLIQSIKYPDLIYMLLPYDFARAGCVVLPLRVDQDNLAGVVVHTANKLDEDGDPLPQIGYVSRCMKAAYFRKYKGVVQLVSN